MNKEQIREEVAEKCFKCWFITDYLTFDSVHQAIRDACYQAAGRILSIKGIRLEADNQDKPQNPYAEAADRGDMHAQSRCSGYYCAQDDMLIPKDGDVWVKCKVKEEK